MTLSVVVTTYNRPDALRAVLEGFCAQTDRGFDLIVADDGSTDQTRALVTQYQGRAPFAVQHVWQEDLGFRAGMVRNRAVAAAKQPYVVFVDGDCVPLPDFVRHHKALQRPGRFVFGHRVLLGQGLTQRVLRADIAVHAWRPGAFFVARLRGDTNRWFPLWTVRTGRHHNAWRGVKTCNLAVWTDDLRAVNGFDEEYEGWGLEDSDLVARLLHNGILGFDGRSVPPVLHLWHPESSRTSWARNEARFQQRLAERRVRAQRGLDQHA